MLNRKYCHPQPSKNVFQERNTKPKVSRREEIIKIREEIEIKKIEKSIIPRSDFLKR